MLPIYICDDDIKIQEFLKREIGRQVMIGNHDMKIKLVTGQPRELLECIEKDPGRGIYFLDVELNQEDMDGFLLGKEIRKKDASGFIIYITSYEDLAFKTFHYHLEALDYITKGDALKMISAIRDCLNVVVKRMKEEGGENVQHFTVKVVDIVKHFPVTDIICFETTSRTHRILLYTEAERIDFIGKLSQIEAELSDKFVRAHRSFLINIEKIKELDLKRNQIIMTSGQVCLMSRTGKAVLMNKLNI